MAYKGFVGSGTVGNFLSTTQLELQFPAERHAGRRATVEDSTGKVAPYFCDGISWNPEVLETTNPLTGGIRLLAGSSREFTGTPVGLALSAYKARRDDSPLINSTLYSPAPTITIQAGSFAGFPNQLSSLVASGRYGVMSVSDTFMQVNGSALQSNITGGAVRFRYCGSKLVVRLKDSVAHNRIRVDGVLARAALIDTTAASNYVQIDFGSNNTRLIEIETSRNGVLIGAWGEATGQFLPAPPLTMKIALAGDSQSANAVSDTSVANADLLAVKQYPRMVADVFDANVILSATPSMGYLEGALSLTTPSRLAEYAGLGADAYVIMMGTNDAPYVGSTYTAAQLKSAVLTVIETVTAINPRKPLTIFGVCRSSSYSTNTSAEAAIASAVTDFNNPLVKFYPICTGTTPLITGTGRQGTTNSTGTSDWIIGPDGTHIAIEGNVALARYVADCLAAHWSLL